MWNELLELGNKFAKKSTWKDFALTKFCLCSMGILIGTRVAPKHKKAVEAAAGIVFLSSYIPLMNKVYRIATEEEDEEK